MTTLIEACGGLEQSSEVRKTEELLKNALRGSERGVAETRSLSRRISYT